MKKFITTKINKPQWRISVPNINSNLFRRSPSGEEDKTSKRSSGFYDFTEAQQDFDQTRSLPNSVYIESTSTSSDEFEDARTMSDKDKSNKESDADLENFQDSEPTCLRIISKNIDDNNSQYEYDVPKISFKFFEKDSKLQEAEDENIYENETPVKSDVKIIVSTPEDKSITPTPESIDSSPIKNEVHESEEYDILPPSHPSEKFVSHTEIYVKSLESIPITVLKSAGSDPNLAIRPRSENGDYDDDFYQVPRPLKVTKRLSQSLKEFDIEDNENTHQSLVESVESDHSSIEHISASQILSKSNTSTPTKIIKDSKLKLRKPGILKKERWDSFKIKFNNIMQEQASKQRVGAYNDKEKIAINLEEMYKNSKSKCKKVFENTSKMFHKKKTDITDSEHFVKKVTARDIEYKLNYSANEGINRNNSVKSNGVKPNTSENDSSFSSTGSNSKEDNDYTGIKKAIKKILTSNDINHVKDNEGVLNNTRASEESKVSDKNDSSFSPDNSSKEEFDFTGIKNAIKKKLLPQEGQNGFEDLRRYVKQGGDFCKELAQILQERAEAETQYAKSLSKLSTKLSRACRENVGGLNEAWKAVAIELETKAEAHRLLGVALLEETAKPLRTLTDTQHRIRKQSETHVDKAAKLLSDWRASEAKGKKHSHTCARENEKLQDAAVLDTTKYGKQTISKSTSLIHLTQIRQNTTDKDNTKLEGKKRKAEDAVRKADIEYYALCVRAERARLEWESAVLRGASTFQALEEERLNNLKAILTSYLHHNDYIGPRLIEASERLKVPVSQADPTKDLTTLQNLRQSSQQVSEQLLPDFYCEHITLAMNRERRKQALVKLLQLIRQDMERERKSKVGLENLSKAIRQTPSFGSEDSQQSVVEKLYHMKSMLTYLEGAKYKVSNALAELDNRNRINHFLATYITITRDKSGLQQSVLKVPQWIKDEWCETDKSPVSQKSLKSNQSDNSDPHNNDVDDPDWLDRGAADGNSNQPDSDFDEFSSQCSSAGDNLCSADDTPIHPIGSCRAIYAYTPNMHDELLIKAGDVITIYRQQEDGWWLGECNGNVGIFPATYVELIQDC